MKTNTMDANERAAPSKWFFYTTTGALLLALLGALASRNEEDIVKVLWLLGGWLVISKGPIKGSRSIKGSLFVFWLGGYTVGLPYALHGHISWGDLWRSAVSGIWVLLIVALVLLGAKVWTLWNGMQ